MPSAAPTAPTSDLADNFIIGTQFWFSFIVAATANLRWVCPCFQRAAHFKSRFDVPSRDW
jgi:hypothetical protein